MTRLRTVKVCVCVYTHTHTLRVRLDDKFVGGTKPGKTQKMVSFLCAALKMMSRILLTFSLRIIFPYFAP